MILLEYVQTAQGLSNELFSFESVMLFIRGTCL